MNEILATGPTPPPGALNAGVTSRAKIVSVAVATENFLIPIPPTPSPRGGIGAWEAATYLKRIARGN
jgi:hypothetical protein